MEDVFALINQFVNMQLAYRHDERPGESYEALDGKKKTLGLEVDTASFSEGLVLVGHTESR